MTQIINNKQNRYDLEERTLKYTQRIIAYVKKLPKSITNVEIIKQLVRAGGSVGANYIEANESLSRKDFIMRIKICKKESKESRYWLTLSEPGDSDNEGVREKEALLKEASEIMKIFGAILEKCR